MANIIDLKSKSLKHLPYEGSEHPPHCGPWVGLGEVPEAQPIKGFQSFREFQGDFLVEQESSAGAVSSALQV